MKSPFCLLSKVLLLLSLFLAQSCGNEDKKNPKIPGVKGPKLTWIDDGLLVAFTIERLSITKGARFAIPEYPNSYIAIEPDLNSDGTVFSTFVSFQDIIDDADRLKKLDPHTLPGGRPIPGVASGKLPAVAFSIPEFHNIGLYLGPQVFALWVPINLGIENTIATFRFYQEGQRVGNISIVGSDSDGENAGLFLALDLSSRAAQFIIERRNYTHRL